MFEKEVGNGVTVCGNLVLDSLVAKSNNTIDLHGDLQMQNDMIVRGNVQIQGSKLNVDNICEFTPGNGVCIGPDPGTAAVATTLNPDATQEGSVTGDAIWQSFVITDTITVGIVNAQVARLMGFTNASMEARIYQGVGTGGTLLGNVLLANYNGGDIDFSALNLELTPGNYTLQLDYPINNLNNYVWLGHAKLPGEPIGSSSLLTLHLTINVFTNGGLKVTATNTCVENTLKLQFLDPNCHVEFVSANIDSTLGEDCAGRLELEVTCFNTEQIVDVCTNQVVDVQTSNTFQRFISFDTGVCARAEIERSNVLVVEPGVTQMMFENEVLDTNGLWDISDAGNIQITGNGSYILTADVTWEGGVTGNYRGLHIVGGGSSSINRFPPVSGGANTIQNVSTVKSLTVGDVVQVLVEHDATANVNIADARFTIAII
jgi:hypothetical protein